MAAAEKRSIARPNPIVATLSFMAGPLGQRKSRWMKMQRGCHAPTRVADDIETANFLRNPLKARFIRPATNPDSRARDCTERLNRMLQSFFSSQVATILDCPFRQHSPPHSLTQIEMRP
jgi:hypothetical protein